MPLKRDIEGHNPALFPLPFQSTFALDLRAASSAVFRAIGQGPETYGLIYNGQGYNRLKDADKYYSSKEIKLKKKKDNIAGLQFVDLISHPARRYILSKNGLANNLKQTSFEQSVVEILVKSKFRRKNGKIEGAGTVFFPQASRQ